MKGRVARTAGERGRAVFLGTFHAFCNALLLERNPKLQTLENVDHWILLRRNLPALALDYYRRLAEPGQFLGDFVQFFSRCQDELVAPDDYERYVAALAERYARERATLPEDEQHLREEEIARQREIARAYRASDRLLRERNRLTFGMQLLDAVRALDEDAALAATLRERYRYILVDEFQDTNVAQIELLWRLAAGHRNIVAVGDNAQAIYRFRGASFGSFTIFLERFAGIPRGDRAAAMPFIQPLVDNYRSAGRVLRVSGQVASFIEHSPLVPKKELVAHKPEGEKVRIVEFGSAAEEGRWIAAEIERLHGAGPALAELRGPLPHSPSSLRIGRGPGGARHSVRDSQPDDPEPPAGARFAGLSAPAGAAIGQRRLRASAGGAGLGIPAERSGAALRARGETQDFAVGRAAIGTGRAALQRPAAPDRRAGCGNYGVAQTRRPADGRGAVRSAGRVAGSFRGGFGERPALRGPPGDIHSRMAAQERNFAARGAGRISRLFRPGRRADQPRAGLRRMPCS